MVPSLSFVFMAVSLLIAIGLPVALTIWVMKKYKPGFWAVASGMIVFFVLQIVIRIPLMQLFAASEAGKAFITNNTLLYVGIAALTAGIFEEFGRYFAFKVMLKNRRGFGHGLAYGIGHGGIEAVVIIGLAYVSNIMIGIMINSGGVSSLDSAGAAMLQPTITALTQTAPTDFLIGGIERVFAICFHIAMSILVLYGVRKRNIAYTLLAVLLHGIVDFGVVTIAGNLGVLWGEAFMFVVAAASIVYVVLMKRIFEKQDGRLQLDG